MNIEKPLIKPTNLKTDFLDIIESYSFKMVCMDDMEELHFKLNRLFTYYGLTDLQYNIKLDKVARTIFFTPVRKIDKLAIEGILATPDDYRDREKKLRRILDLE